MPGRETVEAPAVKWRKSSRSTANGDCVEVAVEWRKSSRSTANGACVEVGAVERAVAVRDSKDPDGPRLGFTARQWAAFLTRVKGNEYDL